MVKFNGIFHPETTAPLKNMTPLEAGAGGLTDDHKC
jgi:hypothetical protein